jgi:hypothetical protein
MDKELFHQMLCALRSAQDQLEQIAPYLDQDKELQEAFEEVNEAVKAAEKVR